MSDIARNKRGHAVMVRTDKRDVTVDERHQFVADVAKEQGISIKMFAHS